MKKQLVSAIVLGVTLTGALVNSDTASACPYARNNQGISNLQNNPNSSFPFVIKKSHSDMMFGVAATVGLLATGWVVASRFNHLSRVSTFTAQDESKESSFAVITSR